MREIACCQLGVYIPVLEIGKFPLREDHLNKQTLATQKGVKNHLPRPIV